MTSRLHCLSARRGVERILQTSTTTSPVAVVLSQSSRRYASAAAATSTVPLASLRLPDNYIPPTQPPSARRPDQRKSQLLRAYTSLLRSTPLILFFQHNNITGVEWAAIRRELRAALAEVATPDGGSPSSPLMSQRDLSSAVEIQVLRTRIFNVAFKIVEFFDPAAQSGKSNVYLHDLSTTAYETISKAETRLMMTGDETSTSTYAQISPLLVGPVAAVTFPAVTPAHLAAVLRVLAPSPPAFPAPLKRKSPGYHDAVAQSGLHKLIMVGGRIEGKVFDNEGVRWVGGIAGGLDGLRAQLVAMLQSAGLGLTTALEGHGKGLWLALEGRRTQLEEETNGDKKEEETSG